MIDFSFALSQSPAHDKPAPRTGENHNPQNNTISDGDGARHNSDNSQNNTIQNSHGLQREPLFHSGSGGGGLGNHGSPG